MFNKILLNHLVVNNVTFFFKKNIKIHQDSNYAPKVFNSFMNPYKKSFLTAFKFENNNRFRKTMNFKHIYSFSNVTIHTKKTRNCFSKYFHIPYAEKHLGMLAKSTKPFHKNQLYYFFYSTIYYFSNILYWNPYQKYYNNNRFFLNGVLLKTLWTNLSQGDLVSTPWLSNIYVLKKKKISFLGKQIFFNHFLSYRIKKKIPKQRYNKNYHIFALTLRNLNPVIYFLDKRTNSLLIIKHRDFFEESTNLMNFNMFSLYAWKILT